MLLWLDAKVRGVAARLQLLDAVGLVAAAAAAAVAIDTTGGAGAAASAQLVDGLQALLGPRLLQGGPQGDHSRGSRLTIMVGGDQALVNLVDQSLLAADNTSREGFDNALRRALENLGIPNEMSFRPFCMRMLAFTTSRGDGKVVCRPVSACTLVVQAAATLRCWWSCWALRWRRCCSTWTPGWRTACWTTPAASSSLWQATRRGLPLL
jgi:hypothetical protein